MKNIISFGSLALLTLSCGSDNDNNAVDNTDPSQQNVILPIKMNVDGENININYDGTKVLNFVSATNPDNKIIFTYSGDLISSIRFFENNILQSSNAYTYTNGLLASYISTEYNDAGAIITNITYTYTHISPSQINVKKQVSFGANNNYIINGTYTYSNGNMVSVIGTGMGTQNGVATSYTINGNYTYTNKNYPFKNVKGFDKLIFNGDNEDGSSLTFSNIKNNLSSYKDVTTHTASNVSGTSYSAYKYSTTYSSNGYPINETMQKTDLNGVPTAYQPQTYTYEYNH